MVAATERTFKIVEGLMELGRARVSELSEYLEMSNSSVYSHLATLRKHGYVVKRGDAYQLGLQFLTVAEYVRHRDPVFRAAKPKVKEVAEKTGEIASLMAENQGRGVFVYRRKGADMARPAIVGNKAYLHATAGGKAILAHMSETRVESIIDEWGLPKRTENTITDRDELWKELEQIRERGVAFNDQEDIEGLRAAAVPVMSRSNQFAWALTVFGPAHTIDGDVFEEEIPDLLLETANNIQLDVAFNERQEQ